jgi:hypothetical protein
LLNLSHYCPVVLRFTDEGPQVLILLNPAMVSASTVDGNGRWRPPYSPIALRSLPFCPGPTVGDVRVAPELAAERHEESYPLRDAMGDPSEQFAAVLAWIGRLRQGMRRLSEAAKLIVAADLLVPIMVHQPGTMRPSETDYRTVCPQRLNRLSAARAAALTVDRCLPLDLLAACMFSRRLLARSVTVQRLETSEPAASNESWKTIDLVKLPDLDVRLDSSPLFSYEQFSGQTS